MAMKDTLAGHIEFPTAKDAPRRHSVQAGSSTVDITNPLLIYKSFAQHRRIRIETRNSLTSLSHSRKGKFIILSEFQKPIRDVWF